MLLQFCHQCRARLTLESEILNLLWLLLSPQIAPSFAISLMWGHQRPLSVHVLASYQFLHVITDLFTTLLTSEGEAQDTHFGLLLLCLMFSFLAGVTFDPKLNLLWDCSSTLPLGTRNNDSSGDWTIRQWSLCAWTPQIIRKPCSLGHRRLSNKSSYVH